ncbi:relaxase/mobilization nuclease [Streptomyces ziwulingensis]|uniref:Relaxase/mobilization nuclease n=1 Tax=Streptomyces ziwulingensis TaxID=1045501 RepID=A0ABP9ALB7_9ACTN
MIPYLHERTHTPRDPLGEALGRPVSPHEVLTEHTIVAHWPGLDHFTLDDEQKTWTSLQWAEHLEGALLEHPFAASPDDDRRAILHLKVRLHPDDRDLSGPEWAEAAHRLARAAGIEKPGKDSGCRWIAVRAQPGRLDLIANLIHLDGAWHTPAAVELIAHEARRIEQDLRLIPARSHAASQPADEQTGPLAAVRGLVEHTAHRIARQPGAAGTEAALRLELIARRLHAIQQDLDTIATLLAQPRPVPAPATVRRDTHRSP